MRRMASALVAAMLTFGIVSPAAADLTEAMERAEAIKKYDAALKEADKITGLVLVEEGLKSDDPQVVRLAFDFAMANQDADFKTLALRHWWANSSSFAIRLIPPQQPTETQKQFLARTPLITITDMSLNDKGEPLARGYQGRFTKGGLELYQSGACSLLIDDLDPDFMAGTYTCPRIEPLAARVELE